MTTTKPFEIKDSEVAKTKALSTILKMILFFITCPIESVNDRWSI
jgi:hypothetical protein